MRRHILPNVTHVVLIVAVLDFSGLVLYEAVLSYVGVGVDPTTNSFGTMINSARNEMSRDPVVWWTLAAAFAFMVALVLSMQFFASAVQRSLRSARPRVPRPARRSRRTGAPERRARRAAVAARDYGAAMLRCSRSRVSPRRSIRTAASSARSMRCR